MCFFFILIVIIEYELIKLKHNSFLRKEVLSIWDFNNLKKWEDWSWLRIGLEQVEWSKNVHIVFCVIKMCYQALKKVL